MKSILPFPACRWIILALLTATLSGCSTLSYRSLQSQFEDAVRADNERLPFTNASERYRAIAEELTPEFIARLDPTLRPNAWTLRAIAQWRSDDLAAALTSANLGLNEIARQSAAAPHATHSRDSVILTMLPGLVEDTRLRNQFNQHGAEDVAGHYPDYSSRFRTALRALSEARAKCNAATPPEVIAYWNYQCWRLLENWLFIISQLPLDNQAEANSEADSFVRSILAHANLNSANTLPTAIASLEASLPPPYSQLIDLERRRQ